MFCTNCGRPLEDDKLGCRFCKDLPEVQFNYCQYCGEKVVGDSSTCSHCEKKIKENIAVDKEESSEEIKGKTVEYIRKRLKVSIALWIIVTVLEIVAVIIYPKLYNFYVIPLFNAFLIIRNIKYFTNSRNDIKNVVSLINKRMENTEILSGFMLVLGIIIGGLPAYYDLKTQKEVLINKNCILK